MDFLKTLGIEENNLPIPNAAEWELKCQRLGTTSLTTLFHIEPSPTAMKLVPSCLLPLYGWKHTEAGKKYPETETLEKPHYFVAWEAKLRVQLRREAEVARQLIELSHCQKVKDFALTFSTK